MSQAPDDGTGSSYLIDFLSDPATLVGLGTVAVGAAYYLSSRPTPFLPPISLRNQLCEVPVSLPHFSSSSSSCAWCACSSRTRFQPASDVRWLGATCSTEPLHCYAYESILGANPYRLYPQYINVGIWRPRL